MTKWTALTILAAALALYLFMPEARTQGICWDGTFVQDLKDCPKRPGTKFKASSGGEDSNTAAQGTLSSGKKKSKAVDTFLKLPDVKGESK